MTASVQYLPVYGQASVLEVRYFEYFMHRIVPGFPKIINEEFWHQIIPQFSITDRVVWNAVNAMSILLQQPKACRKRTTLLHERHLALRSYNKSVTGLQARLEQNLAWSAACSITCILYICIECLQGNFAEAMAIYKRALAMILSLDNLHILADESNVYVAVKALLEHMAVSRGQADTLPKALLNPGTGYASMRHARADLNLLVTEAHQFICDIGEIKLAKANNNEKMWVPPLWCFQDQKYLIARMVQWRAAVACIVRHLDQYEEEMYHVGLLAYEHYFILVSALLSTFETAYDDFFDNFRNMIQHAQSLITAFNDLQIVFSFETRFIPMLAFLTHRCRHPQLRRQAISLLRKGPQMENLWKADHEIRVAETSVAFEESGCRNAVFTEDTQASLPPEEFRIFKKFDLPGDRIMLGTWQRLDDRWVVTEHIVNY